MALFFLVVGPRNKYEFTAGELTNPRKALLPIIAAVGGAVLPALVYLAFNMGSGFEHGWGVPMAERHRVLPRHPRVAWQQVPAGLRAFLSTLTIVDDMIAILVIAVFYTANLNVIWLAAGLALFAVLIVLNRMHVYGLAPYLLIGLALWVCILLSGVHATVAGVLVALTIPAQSQVKLGRVNTWFEAKAQNADERYVRASPISRRRSTLKRSLRSAAYRA